MASDDATRRSELLPPPTDGSQYETVSVGPGNAIAVSRITPSDNYCSTFETGEIQLVDRETSGVETVGRGRYPAISPDGRRVAWVGVTDCNFVLRVLDLGTKLDAELDSSPRYPGGADPQFSGPIAWAPDSRHLYVPVNIEPTREYWYVDLDAADSELSGPRVPPPSKADRSLSQPCQMARSLQSSPIRLTEAPCSWSRSKRPIVSTDACSPISRP